MTSVPMALLAEAPSIGHGVDVLAAVLLVFCAVRGGIRGLTGEVAQVAGFAGAFAVSYSLASFWGELAGRWFPGENQTVWRAVLLASGMVVSATLASVAIRRTLDRFLRLLLDQPANAILGVLAGFLRAALLAIGILFLASFVAGETLHTALFADSIAGRAAYPAVLRLRERTQTFLPPRNEQTPVHPGTEA